MGLLTGKKALIFGVANDHSIAWGIAQALHREGATLGFSYAGEKFERRVRPLAESLGSTFIEPCDVSKDEEIAAIVEKTRAQFGEVDILVHSIAFANRDDLAGAYHTVSRANFALANGRQRVLVHGPGQRLSAADEARRVDADPHVSGVGARRLTL